MELNTLGSKGHAFSLEIIWFPILISAKCRANSATCSDMYRYLVPILEKNPTM